MDLKIEVEQEQDGRWIAEAIDLPGCMAYGKTQVEALTNVRVLALHLEACGDKCTTQGPNSRLNLEEDSPELEAELLKAANGPFKPYSSEEMRAICDKILQEKQRQDS